MTRTQPPTLGVEVPLDVERLIETRLAAEANSGAGKSWFLRRLLEQTAGHCQQIVIDPEDEFHTLREKSDYILCSPKGGDAVADLKSAALLARRLLELNVSAIVAIYELGVRRAEFVKLFVDAIMSAPRDLWHPAMIVVDEAGKFCPESDKAESTAAVVNLMTTGRKRGFCGILATQRISTLNKSALAECNNVVIGRTGLDIDIARAASILGMKIGEAKDILKNLDPGEFYGYGPAISREVIRFRVGPVATTHPKAGQRAIPPAPPTAAIREILGRLADLPAEAEEEAKTVVELRAEITKLRASNTRLTSETSKGDVTSISTLTKENKYLLETRTKFEVELKSANADLDTAETWLRQLKPGISRAQRELELSLKTLEESSELDKAKNRIRAGEARVVANNLAAEFAEARTTLKRAGVVVDATAGTITSAERSNTPLSKMVRAILIALREHGPGLTKREIFWRTGYSHGGASTTAFSEINRCAWAVADKGALSITAAGITALGAYEPLPLPTLSAIEREILGALAQHPHGLTKKAIFVRTGYRHGGQSTAAFSTLHKHGWIHGRPTIRITGDGLEVLGDFEAMPTGAALRQSLLASDKLSPMEKKFLGVVCDVHPNPIGKGEIFERTGYSHGGASTTAFSRLVGLGYVHKAGAGKLRASEELFG